MSAITEKYKDIEIQYDEDKNKWVTGKYSAEQVEHESLKAAKAAIDRKLKVKYIEQSVWSIMGVSKWGLDRGFKDIKQCTATRPHNAKEVWITDGKGRTTEDMNRVYLDTDKNRSLFLKIAEQEQIAGEAKRRADELIKELETIGEMRPVS